MICFLYRFCFVVNINILNLFFGQTCNRTPRRFSESDMQQENSTRFLIRLESTGESGKKRKRKRRTRNARSAEFSKGKSKRKIHRPRRSKHNSRTQRRKPNKKRSRQREYLGRSQQELSESTESTIVTVTDNHLHNVCMRLNYLCNSQLYD